MSACPPEKEGKSGERRAYSSGDTVEWVSRRVRWERRENKASSGQDGGWRTKRRTKGGKAQFGEARCDTSRLLLSTCLLSYSLPSSEYHTYYFTLFEHGGHDELHSISMIVFGTFRQAVVPHELPGSLLNNHRWNWNMFMDDPEAVAHQGAELIQIGHGAPRLAVSLPHPTGQSERGRSRDLRAHRRGRRRSPGHHLGAGDPHEGVLPATRRGRGTRSRSSARSERRPSSPNALRT